MSPPKVRSAGDLYNSVMNSKNEEALRLGRMADPFYGPGQPQRPGLGLDTAALEMRCGRKTYEGLALVGTLAALVILVPAAFVWGRKATRA